MKGDFLVVDRAKMAGVNSWKGLLQQPTIRNNNFDEDFHETAANQEEQTAIFPNRYSNYNYSVNNPGFPFATSAWQY